MLLKPHNAECLNIDFSGEQNRGFQIAYNSGPIRIDHTSDARQRPDPKPFCNVPFRRNLDFVDHGNVLPLINDAMARPSARFALTGLGGIGKSQFVIEFAYRFRESLPSNGPPAFCLWVDASSQSRFENSFIDIAVQLGLVQRGPEITERQRDVLQAVKDWLVDERNGNWVLIVDNADDHSVLFAPDTEGGGTRGTKRSLADFLPQSPNGKVLVNSRSKTLARRLVGCRPADVLEVQPMPYPQALDLMRKSLSVDQSDDESALELLKTLDFIPLAIAQATAYINQKRPFTSIPKYLEGLRQNGPAARHLLDHNADGIDFDGAGSRSILSTMRLSWDFIHKLRPSAVQLLSLMAFFNCQSVQTFLLRRYRYQYAYDCRKRHYGRLRYTTLGGSPESYFSLRPWSNSKLFVRFFGAPAYTLVPSSSQSHSQSRGNHEILHAECRHPTANSEKEFEEDVRVLQDFSLVSSSTDGSALQMHSLVRASIRAWLKDFKEDKKWQSLSYQVLAEEFPLYPEFESLHVCEQLLTHVELDAEPPPYEDAPRALADKILGGGPYAIPTPYWHAYKDWAQIIVAVGSYASSRGDECLLRKITEMALQILDDHWREAFHKNVVFPVFASLANQFINIGDYAAAKTLLNDLEDDRERLPEHHPDLYMDLRARAMVYSGLRRPNKAKALFRKILDTWSNIDGENGIRTVDAKHALGILLSGQGKYEEARSMLSSLKGPCEEVFGEKHPRTLSVNIFLARALHEVAEFEAAESLLQRVFGDLRRRI